MKNFGKTTNPPFYALIGDLVASREIDDRDVVQEAVRTCIKRINSRMRRKFLAAPASLTAGDEIQILGRSPDFVMNCVVSLSDAILPHHIRFGFGVGGLATSIGSRPQVAQLDGQCFHRARAALQRAHDRNAWVQVAGLGTNTDPALSSLFELMGTIRHGWTHTQGNHVASMRTGDGGFRRQSEVADKFGVGASVVSQSLKAAHYQPLIRSEKATEALLSELAKNAELSQSSVK